MARNGVLILATGGAASLEDVEPFLRALTGSEPSAETVGTLRRAMLTVGGRSPASAIAERVAAALERSLNGLPPAPPEDEPGDSLLPLVHVAVGRTGEPTDVPVAVGFLASPPHISETLDRLRDAGVERVVLLPLSPFDPPSRAAAARSAARVAAAELGIELVDARDYAGTDPYVRAITEVSQSAVEDVFPEHRPVVIFVAPALTVAEAAEGAALAAIEEAATRIAQEIGMGAPDPDGLEAAVGLRAFGGPGLAAPWMLAYLSESGTGGPVVGPTVEAAIAAAKSHGFGGVALLPFAYTVDDMSTLYHLDVETADAVLAADMECARAAVLNDGEDFIEALETAVRAVL